MSPTSTFSAFLVIFLSKTCCIHVLTLSSFIHFALLVIRSAIIKDDRPWKRPSQVKLSFFRFDFDITITKRTRRHTCTCCAQLAANRNEGNASPALSLPHLHRPARPPHPRHVSVSVSTMCHLLGLHVFGYLRWRRQEHGGGNHTDTKIQTWIIIFRCNQIVT